MIRHVHLWLGSYVRDEFRFRGVLPKGKIIDLLFCVADHYEPLWQTDSETVGDRRVDIWSDRFPKLAARHRDADGRGPVHSFFFAAEQFRPKWIEALAGFADNGLGEVEIHLHHGHDTREGLKAKLLAFQESLSGWRLLSSERGSRQARYGFIHGDWALANSGPGDDTCGVDDELEVLIETGCYGDFTFPSAPSETQIPTINRIFFADPKKKGPKPHARGIEASVGRFRPDDFMLFAGPLGLDWERRKFGLLPRIENGDLSAGNPPHPRRIPLWLKHSARVAGRPEWRFIKLYTHGCAERNHEALLGGAMDSLLDELEGRYNDGKRFRLHYVSAREMHNIARAAMDGKGGDAGEYRDYQLVPRWRKPA
ncbi:MAG: hypothetical protein V1495_07115 [Pseudomonadota bacterium]